MLTLHIQIISKPEMSLDEAEEYIARYFPGIDAFPVTFATAPGSVSLTMHQDALSDEQRDWLHLDTFSARYIDSFEVEVQ